MRALLPFAWDRLPSGLETLRKSFYCADIFKVQTLNPFKPQQPDFLLFTSQNAVAATTSLGWNFEGVEAHCVGQKTYERAQAAGLNARLLGPPPAQDCVASLPSGQGLWLSGQQVANELPIERLPIYALGLDDKVEVETLRVLKSNKIRNIFITSEQVAAWAGKTGLKFEGAAALSPRLAEAAHNHLPDLQQVWTVPDFESGVRVLYASPYGDKFDE